MGGRGKLISASDRRALVELIKEAVKAGATVVNACAVARIAYTSYRKWEQNPDDVDGRLTVKHKRNPRALSEAERQKIVEAFCAPEVCDLSIRQAYYALLDQGIYVGSESTVYRVLKAIGANKRRDGTHIPVRRHKPTSYMATGPNQVWSWDITYLKDAKHATRFYYVFAIIDIYSRMIVHIDVFENESADNAVAFLEKAFDDHFIRPRTLVLHSDNGSAMKSAKTLALLERRGVQFSHSRPRVSDDNPYIEALFKTMKYAGYMGKRSYNNLATVKSHLEKFVRLYNEQWPHTGINNVTPKARFEGTDTAIQRQRDQVLEQAKACHPERWIRGTRRQHVVAGPQTLNPDRLTMPNGSSPKAI